MRAMSSRPVPDTFEHSVLSRLFGILSHAAIGHAVLRNHNHLPVRLGARDLDLIVRPADLQRAVAVIVRVARDFGLQSADFYADERMTQLAFVGRRKQGLFDLKIDLFTSSQVFGIELMSAEEMLADLRWHNGIPVVSEHVQLLDKWLFHLAVGRPLHRKYDERFARIARENRPSLLERLAPLLGRAEAERQLAAVAAGAASLLAPLRPGPRIRMLARMWGRQDTNGLASTARFIGERLRNRLSPHGLLVSVSGPDGSGKTTVIDLALAELRQIYGTDSVDYHHFRPSVLPRIAEVARAAGGTDKVDTDYARPHRARPSGVAGSLARLSYYGMDYVLGYFRVIRPALTDRRVVLFDRYYHDMICDPGRSRVRLPRWCLRAAASLLPRPGIAFFVKVAPEVAYARKAELAVDQIADLNRRYGDLVRRRWMVEIGNHGPAEEAAAAIVDHIVALRGKSAWRALEARGR